MEKLPSTEQIQWLHKAYNALTRLDVPWSMSRHYQWEYFMALGYGQVELELVVRYIKRRIKDGRRYPESLLFRNLVARTENFAEDLSMARAEERAIKDRGNTARKEILRAANISLDQKPDNGVRSAAQILAGMEALKKLQALKETL